MLFVACFFAMILYIAVGGINKSINTTKQEYLQYQAGNINTSTGIRINMYKTSLQLIKQRPIIGYGTGGVRNTILQNTPQIEHNAANVFNFVESSVLNFFLEFGVLGFLVFVWAMAVQFRGTKYMNTDYKYIMRSFLILYLAGSMVNSFFTSFVESHLYSIISAICFSSMILNQKKKH